MGVLSKLEPKEVFTYFEEICGIPHGSYQEKEISDYCVAFAKEHHLEVVQDELKNVMIKKKATQGYEEVPAIIIQGHLDMVCEKEAMCEIDFTKDGLTLEIEGDYISAKGTTLGGDDGIAIAYTLALLASVNLPHPAIEAVFTVSEEVGMEGAAGIDLSGLMGKRLLNIDSEEEGVLLTSCAGGARINAKLPIARVERAGVIYELAMEHLTGGHSGVEIDKGLANANILMTRTLLSLEAKLSYDLVEMNGGLKDNAIPRESRAILIIAQEDAAKLEAAISAYEVLLKQEYRIMDSKLTLQAVKKETQSMKAFTKEDSHKLLMLMSSLPNGIQEMSRNVKGLVETSLNLGVLKTEADSVKISYAIRSSVGSAKEALKEKMQAIIAYMGAEFSMHGDYPEWEYREQSELRDTMITVYREMYGKEPKIEAVHAGLECGLLSAKIKNLDAVSFGPDMKKIHTTEEQLSISSTKRVWEYMLRILAVK